MRPSFDHPAAAPREKKPFSPYRNKTSLAPRNHKCPPNRISLSALPRGRESTCRNRAAPRPRDWHALGSGHTPTRTSAREQHLQQSRLASGRAEELRKAGNSSSRTEEPTGGVGRIPGWAAVAVENSSGLGPGMAAHPLCSLLSSPRTQHVCHVACDIGSPFPWQFAPKTQRSGEACAGRCASDGTQVSAGKSFAAAWAPCEIDFSPGCRSTTPLPRRVSGRQGNRKSPCRATGVIPYPHHWRGPNYAVAHSHVPRLARSLSVGDQ